MKTLDHKMNLSHVQCTFSIQTKGLTTCYSIRYKYIYRYSSLYIYSSLPEKVINLCKLNLTNVSIFLTWDKYSGLREETDTKEQHWHCIKDERNSVNSKDQPSKICYGVGNPW